MPYTLKYTNGPNDAYGSVPDYGAIFMSSTATKQECLERKLFGLPAFQAQFVKQVKSGMLLFLFEYERRELHGVFQACTDGAMNIVPHAFSSLGKKFPAQVEFNQIWCCDPLLEHDFFDAIKENYFSAYKFNFGLSENQARRLLALFSLKIKKQSVPMLLTRNKLTNLSRHSADEIGRQVAYDDKLVSDNRFRTISGSLNNQNHNDYPLDNITKSPGNIRLGIGKEVKPEFNENDDFVPGNSSGCQAFCSNHNLHSDGSKLSAETGAPHKLDSVLHGSGSTKTENLPYSDDANGANEQPDMTPYWCASSLEVNQGTYDPTQHIVSYVRSVVETYPIYMNQSTSSMDSRGKNNPLDFDSELCNHSPPGSNNTGNQTSECQGGCFVPMPNLDCLASSGTGNHVVRLSACANRLGSNNSYASVCLQGSQNKLDWQMPEHKNSKVDATDDCAFTNQWSQRRDHISLGEPKIQKSVFDRLTVTECLPKHRARYISYSIDDVMAMLPQHDDGRGKTKRSWSINNDKVVNSPKMTIKEILDNEDNSLIPQQPFLDFKRRSEVRIVSADSKARETTQSMISNSSQQKRRKLVRPNFEKDQLYEDKGDNPDPIERKSSSSEATVSKRSAGDSESRNSCTDIHDKVSVEIEKVNAVGGCETKVTDNCGVDMQDLLQETEEEHVNDKISVEIGKGNATGGYETKVTDNYGRNIQNLLQKIEEVKDGVSDKVSVEIDKVIDMGVETEATYNCDGNMPDLLQKIEEVKNIDPSSPYLNPEIVSDRNSEVESQKLSSGSSSTELVISGETVKCLDDGTDKGREGGASANKDGCEWDWDA